MGSSLWLDAAGCWRRRSNQDSAVLMSGLTGLWAADEGLQKPLIMVVNVEEAGDGMDARSPGTGVSTHCMVFEGETRHTQLGTPAVHHGLEQTKCTDRLPGLEISLDHLVPDPELNWELALDLDDEATCT